MSQATELVDETSKSITDLAGIAEEQLDETEETMKFLQAEMEVRRGGVRERLLLDEARASNVHLDTPDIEAFLREPYSIEVDFLFGSRRQEGQRLGRLFHADEKGEHWILMTREQHALCEKRVLAIREKGFRIHREVIA